MVEAKRGKGKGPSPERVLELVQEAREVAKQFGCPVVVNAPGENGTASIPIGKTPELTAFTPNQQHVIFPPEGGRQVFPTKIPTAPVGNDKPAEPEREKGKGVKPQKKGKVHNLAGFTGSWRGKYYKDGVAQNGNNGRGNRKKR